MSSRARRVTSPAQVVDFDWGAPPPPRHVAPLLPGHADQDRQVPQTAQVAEQAAAEADAAQHQARLAALEREAFAKGYAAGERAGAEAGGKRAEATLRRLAQTIEDLGRLRNTMVQQTERQMVQLALAVARRIVGREIALDPDLIVAMARVALDRLGEGAPATIRLHPDDLAAIGQVEWGGPHVQIVGDPAVARGGCVVESAFGLIDASVDAQFDQIAQVMLGDAEPSGRVVPLRRAS